MVSHEQPNRQAEISEVMQLTLGPEYTYYVEKLQSLDPEKFAVIKVGGATVRDDLDQLAGDLTVLSNLGLYPVIVHGGGPQIDADLRERGIEEQKVDGIRITNEETLTSVERGLESVNRALTTALESRGVQAAGITKGIFDAEIDGSGRGFVGKVLGVDNAALDELIQRGVVPVVSCLGQDSQGNPLNVNADSAAAALALSRAPHRYIALSDVSGVMDHDRQVIPVLNGRDTAEDLIRQEVISRGMIPKVRHGFDLLENLPADSSVVITSPDHLLRELFTHRGAGTLLRHGDRITHLDSVEAVDQQKVKGLIQRAFGKRLVDHYFEELPIEAEIFITDRDYRGLAIVIPGEEGYPAYVDKLVVEPESTGYGIGDEIIRKVCEEHPQGVYWRVRKDNKSLDWYRSRGLGQEYDPGGDYLVFFTEEVKPEQRPMFASLAMLIEPTVVAEK